MRFLSAQLLALFGDDLWLRNALHANRMAKLLVSRVRRIRGVRVMHRVEANAVFARIPRRAVSRMRREYFFYVWDEEESVVRWMCSWDTTEEDVDDFARLVARAVRS
jgi:threonine aldolase